METRLQQSFDNRFRKPRPPFFEIGTKSYLVGDEVIDLARAADAASVAYDIDILFTAPYVDIRSVVQATERLLVCSPHMDPLHRGRGLTEILPEALVAAGCSGVMLNHAEHPLTISALTATIDRAREAGLFTIVCADSIREARAIAILGPDIIVAEPTELIGTGRTSDHSYVVASNAAIKAVDPTILVLQGAGIRTAEDVYAMIASGAEATGSSSGIANATDRDALVRDMIAAVRAAWESRSQEGKA